MIINKITTLITLFTLCFNGVAFSSSVSDKDIFMNGSTARRLVGDLKYCNQTIKDQGTLLKNCQTSNQLADKEISTLKETRENLKSDLTLVTTAKDEYKELYVTTNNELIKEREDKPSRFTWFSLGGLTALILGVIAAIAVK
jgi:hypothetical protein